MTKPLMLYHSLNLHALKGKNVHMLPVFWRANRKAWVTAAIFMNQLHYCFVPQEERYLAEQNLAFKVLLLVNNTPGQPGNLKVEVIFLLPNTTYLKQPRGNLDFQNLLYPPHISPHFWM